MDFYAAFFLYKEETEVKEKKGIEKNTKYGGIKLLLKEIMDERGITVEQMSKKIGVEYDVVANFYYNEIQVIDSEILAKFCHVLNCNIKDLMKYSYDFNNV